MEVDISSRRKIGNGLWIGHTSPIRVPIFLCKTLNKGVKLIKLYGVLYQNPSESAKKYAFP